MHIAQYMMYRDVYYAMLANVASTSVLANAGSAHHHETHTLHIIMKHTLYCTTDHHQTHTVHIIMKHTLYKTQYYYFAAPQTVHNTHSHETHTKYHQKALLINYNVVNI